MEYLSSSDPQETLKKYGISVQKCLCSDRLKNILLFPHKHRSALNQLKSQFKKRGVLSGYYDGMYHAGAFFVGVKIQKNREGNFISNSESYTVLDGNGLILKKMRGPFSKLNNQNIYFEIYEVDEKNGEESGKVAYYDENLQLIIDELNWNVRVMAADSEGILFFSSQTKQRAFLTFGQHRELQWVGEEDAVQKEGYQNYYLKK